MTNLSIISIHTQKESSLQAITQRELIFILLSGLIFLLDLLINEERIGTYWLLPLLVFGGTHALFGNPVFVLWGNWFRRLLPFSKILYQNIDWVVRYVYTLFSELFIVQVFRKSGLKVNLPIKNIYHKLSTRLNKYQM